MTWSELKATLSDTADDAEIYIDVPDDDGDIPILESCEVDEDGDVILVPGE
jgi:hypothetical protein